MLDRRQCITLTCVTGSMEENLMKPLPDKRRDKIRLDLFDDTTLLFFGMRVELCSVRPDNAVSLKGGYAPMRIAPLATQSPGIHRIQHLLSFARPVRPPSAVVQVSAST